jgi:plastocyanin
MTSRIVRAAALTAAVAAAAIWMSVTPVLAADRAVKIDGFAFSPPRITVAVGDTVTWSNSDAQSHTATADDGSFDTGTIPGGRSGSATFSAAGTFAYHCKIHPSMTATVVVADSTAPATDALDVSREIRSAPSWPIALVALLAVLVGVGRFASRRPS